MPLLFSETHYSYQFYPNSIKPYHCKSVKKAIEVTGLKPNQTIFYFAADNNENIQNFPDAYGSLKNSGVTRINTNGVAKIYLKCPGLYYNPDDKLIHPRHFHFLYWKNGKWDLATFTNHKIFCDVNKKTLRSFIIVDALPSSYYNKKHITGAISIPHNKHHTREEVMQKLGNPNQETPIVIYCWSNECNAAHKLKEKFDKFGLYNTWHLDGGISKWKGDVSS